MATLFLTATRIDRNRNRAVRGALLTENRTSHVPLPRCRVRERVPRGESLPGGGV